ncbi:CHD3-type chromatin-remodeling factor PICKLE-like [Heracleum sosnowskyi]|uniref:CHD3-type chromatin-remodeling factor PICKLE-like n=1 Tax=Heracleum sosnowskyi TaxID=360622 RepID=A0AAD8HZV9_9APIA|nr:CHD3-type chromatin-remodeling factor PICKLE-like [Heracleum sosnowskyi]
MSSLVERLRVRSDRKPVYNLDDSEDDSDVAEGKSKSAKTFEKIVRADAKDDLCQACDAEGDLLFCESCTYAYHPKCLLPPLKAPLPSGWRCPECVSPLIDIDKILDCEMRPTAAADSDASDLGSKQIFIKQYLVKWKGLSYLHCTWVPEKDFVKAFKAHPRLRTKLNFFQRQMSSTSSDDEFVAIRPEWTTVDRIVARRGADDQKEYLVKWKELSYEECSWEFQSDISSFQSEIDKFNKIRSRYGKETSKKPKSSRDAALKAKQKEFQQYEKSPEFLTGGSLHPYQLEGLNFLRFSYYKQTHVILADEMGLGKTIQSIAFLASLFKENISPHLVVAPLSTLRNWEREFATWAPQMNVVMYVGSSQARHVIREYEFYFPKKLIKNKKKKPSQSSAESKQARIKFDVLLTSYEMINLDSASLKPIKWECMIVDEGHRLKNKDSKLFLSLKQYATRHRSLLTGTPLQNNLDELFMLMHFLDAGKFGSLEEFQEEFKDINQEEQISRLHKMLAPHLLRRVKKDVMKELPPKRELILRVDLSSKQKEYYKAILTRNYQLLTRRGGAQISLINVVMELRKLCCHAFMLEGVEPQDTTEFNKQLLECSGKLHLMDKMMVKLKEQGHRVLIYTQFQHMLDLLEDYCNCKKWHYERIDGTVAGAERQIRIDRFNAKNSSRFCFLLSTRAGGLGINLATADTVIIYDSDWNPHADLQAMARAHRLGQTNKVMIFRLITRGTIEERMMQLTKKKMVLEHLVVGKLKTQNINQEELDDIIKYGSKELFADENDEAGKSRQIHYDAAAIDRLLDRDQVVDEEATLDEEEDGFLKAFKVANFEYIDETEAKVKEEAQILDTDNKATVNNSESANYWDDLLKDRFEEHKVEEFNAMGKGKRSRKQMVSVDDDDLAGLEDISSNGEDDNYDTDDGTDNEIIEATLVRRPSKKKSRVDSVPHPLMEGEGKSFRVLGFTPNQRATFVQILMRFGVGEFDWAEFTPRLKQKTFEEIHAYGKLFLAHIAEEINDSPTFSDGVPKEGLRIQDVLVRIAILLLMKEKIQSSSELHGAPLFSDDIVHRLPGLRCGRFWKEEQDVLLLRAVLKHGYGRWQAIVDDKELRVQELICHELNIPYISFPVAGAQAQVSEASGSQAQATGAEGSQAQRINISTPETVVYNSKTIVGGNGSVTDATKGAGDGTNRAQVYQDFSSHLSNFREMQRRQVEFIKKRVLLLEKALNAEYQKQAFADENTYEIPAGDMETESIVADIADPNVKEKNSELSKCLPHLDVISPEEISAAACDDNTHRMDTAHLYNKMCNLLDHNVHDCVAAHLTSKPVGPELRQNLLPLESIYQGICQNLRSGQQSFSGAESVTLKTDKLSSSEAIEQNNKAEIEMEAKVPAVVQPITESVEENTSSACDMKTTDFCSLDRKPASTNGTGGDVKMEEVEAEHTVDSGNAASGSSEKKDPAVIYLDD